MDLTTIRARLRRQVGNPTTTDVPNSELNEHINTAYREIADRFRFHSVRKVCQFPTIDGTRRYGLPADCSVVRRARDVTNEQRLEKLDDRRAYELQNTSVEGKPTAYVRFKTWIELHPTPDAVYTIELHYTAEITELSADSDEPVLPEAWHQGILLLAKFYYYDDKGDTPKAISAFQMYEAWASSKPVEVDEEKLDFDSGVSLPTLTVAPRRLDFDHSD